MKRALVGILFSFFALAGIARAADAVALAAQQEAQENYKRLTATLEEYRTTQDDQQKRISALTAELGKLRDELARNNNDAAHKESQRQISLLGEQIQKVDKARVADNERIEEALKRLGEAIKKMPVAAPPRRAGGGDTGTPAAVGGGRTPAPRGNSGGAAEEGYDYEILPGDRLDKIVAKYQSEKIMVTSKAIQAANPTVDWNRLKVGSKIFIPKPKP